MRTLALTASCALVLLAACDRATPGAADTARTPPPASGSTSGSASNPAAGAPPSPVRSESAAVVTPAGYGTVRIGTPVGRLAAALRPSAGVAAAGHLQCGYAPTRNLPAGVRLFVLDDRIVRIDVDSAGPRTADGVGVGDSEARVLEVYGARARTAPHKYTGPTGHYITVVAADDTLARIVFETDGRRVLAYRAGRLPAVGLVEGCG